jgi:hypothetical protein
VLCPCSSCHIYHLSWSLYGPGTLLPVTFECTTKSRGLPNSIINYTRQRNSRVLGVLLPSVDLLVSHDVLEHELEVLRTSNPDALDPTDKATRSVSPPSRRSSTLRHPKGSVRPPGTS